MTGNRTVTGSAPGSYLVLTHPASDVNAEVVAEGARRCNQSVTTWTMLTGSVRTAR